MKVKNQTQTQPEIPMSGKNIMVPDTNVLIESYESVNELRRGGNLLVIPLTVIHELDALKDDPRVGYAVRRAIGLIDEAQELQDETLIVESGLNFSRLNLDKNKPDHQIIACLNYVYLKWVNKQEPYAGYDKIKMITNDLGVKILARSVNKKHKIIIEQYKKGLVKIQKKDLEVPYIYIAPEKVAMDWTKNRFFSVNSLSAKIPDGSAFIGYTNRKNSKRGEFAAVRRGDMFEIVDPQISSCGIRPKIAKDFDTPNWEQALALYYCLNPDFDCVFLQGAAGSGKTLIAMAAALEQKQKGLYDKVLIFRVPEPVDRKKTLGLLPGDAGAKIGLYLRPIAQALKKLITNTNSDYISTNNAKNNRKKNNGGEENQRKGSNLMVHVDDLFERYGIEVAVLEYVRGENIDHCVIIVDDAQNISEHEAKTLITRVGEGSKIIFTGDLKQIDSPNLTESSSGFAHLIKKMGHDAKIGVVTLKQALRSRLATLANKFL